MALPEILQRLDRLNKSSAKFPDQLASLLCGKGYEDSVPKLRNEDAVWLLEYLDNVCLYHALFTLRSADVGSWYS